MLSSGYGLRSIELLKAYYEGKLPILDESTVEAAPAPRASAPVDLSPRGNLPPLLCRLGEKSPDRLDWFGVSFGITAQLLRFWKKVLILMPLPPPSNAAF